MTKETKPKQPIVVRAMQAQGHDYAEGGYFAFVVQGLKDGVKHATPYKWHGTKMKNAWKVADDYAASLEFDQKPGDKYTGYRILFVGGCDDSDEKANEKLWEKAEAKVEKFLSAHPVRVTPREIYTKEGAHMEKSEEGSEQAEKKTEERTMPKRKVKAKESRAEYLLRLKESEPLRWACALTKREAIAQEASYVSTGDEPVFVDSSKTYYVFKAASAYNYWMRRANPVKRLTAQQIERRKAKLEKMKARVALLEQEVGGPEGGESQ